MVLVTGATGLLGGHLLYRFRESAHTTIALYRSEERKETTRTIFESYATGQGKIVDKFIWIQADLLEIPSLETALKGVTIIYHCAASIEADTFEQIKLNNITGTENIINVALSEGVESFCHVSSISALGESIGDLRVNETDFFNLDALHTDYAISKFGAEMEVWRAGQEGMNVIIVNPGIIIGEGVWDRGSGKLFSKTLEGNKFYTDGKSGFVDVRDVAKIMTTLVELEIYNERFILVSENITYQQILEKIALSLHVKPPKYRLSKLILTIVSIGSYFLKIFGFSRALKRSTVKSLTDRTEYDNAKILEHIGYSFTSMESAIDRVAKFALLKKIK